MPKFLVKARVRQGAREEFESRLADGSLVRGQPSPEALAREIRNGHSGRGELYFTVDARDDRLLDLRPSLETVLDIVSVQPVRVVTEAEFDDLGHADDAEAE